MAAPGQVPAFIIAVLILCVGIIHIGVAIGIIVKYQKYSDILRQSVGLAGFNVVVGILGILTGIISVFTVMKLNTSMGKILLISTFVLGVFAMASLITALILNSQAIGYVRTHLAYRMNSYNSIQSSITIVDDIQTRYQCCGQNTWLDWASVSLGATTGSGVSTVTDGIGNGNNNGIVTGRRRRFDEGYLDRYASPLVKAVRFKRQVSSSNTYGLPTGYSVNLPLSCCISGGTTAGNTVGGYCTFSSSNGTNNFYVEGCLAPVANVIVSQITGIAVINVCLAILAFVFPIIIIRLLSADMNTQNSNTKQSAPDQQQQVQQYQDGAYYPNYNNPNAYYAYNTPAYYPSY